MAARRSQIPNKNLETGRRSGGGGAARRGGTAGEMYFECGGEQWENTPRVNMILEGLSEKIYPNSKSC